MCLFCFGAPLRVHLKAVLDSEMNHSITCGCTDEDFAKALEDLKKGSPCSYSKCNKLVPTRNISPCEMKKPVANRKQRYVYCSNECKDQDGVFERMRVGGLALYPVGTMVECTVLYAMGEQDGTPVPAEEQKSVLLLPYFSLDLTQKAAGIRKLARLTTMVLLVSLLTRSEYSKSSNSVV